MQGLRSFSIRKKILLTVAIFSHFFSQCMQSSPLFSNLVPRVSLLPRPLEPERSGREERPWELGCLFSFLPDKSVCSRYAGLPLEKKCGKGKFARAKHCTAFLAVIPVLENAWFEAISFPSTFALVLLTIRLQIMVGIDAHVTQL